MTIVRLNRSRYSPKDSTGGRLHSGAGIVLAMACSTQLRHLALACLEVLVHIRDVGLIPADYTFCEVDVPEALIGRWTLTGEAALAKIESPVLSREYGDAWFRRTMRLPYREAFLKFLPDEIDAAV
jgi:hypothetical protein